MIFGYILYVDMYIILYIRTVIHSLIAKVIVPCIHQLPSAVLLILFGVLVLVLLLFEHHSVHLSISLLSPM